MKKMVSLILLEDFGPFPPVAQRCGLPADGLFARRSAPPAVL